MREIVLDTETTGLDPTSGDRLVEIAGVEMINMVLTGNVFHVYINPERDMPEEAFRIHGLSGEFLASKPVFKDVYQEFIDFIQDSRLVIHNAEFDMKFINSEVRRLGVLEISKDRVFDTLGFARRKHPGASNSLDALCTRYRINNSKRTKHGALLDAELLAEVYIELMGGRQTMMSLAVAASTVVKPVHQKRVNRSPGIARVLSFEDENAHRDFVTSLGAARLWNDYIE